MGSKGQKHYSKVTVFLRIEVGLEYRPLPIRSRIKPENFILKAIDNSFSSNRGGEIATEKTFEPRPVFEEIRYNLKIVNLPKNLAKPVKTLPQNVYKSITNAVQHKLIFITRTTALTEKLYEGTEPAKL